jgi:tRNA pseudouridine38-40 synthase
MTRRIALVLEYDGTRYAGFQLQSTAPSIQAALEEAVQRLTGEPSRIHGAGRTDAGVHAIGQVVRFDTESELAMERFRPGLNYYLPEDIAVRVACEANANFDPRRQAVARVYRYAMIESDSRSPLRGWFAHHVGRTLDVAAMNEAVERLQGERDFAPFCGNLPDGGSTVRYLYRTQVWRQDGDEVLLELEANAYLHQQVRRIAAAVLNVGLGKTTIEAFTAVADSKVHGAAALVLPAKGLTLRRVEYKDFSPLTASIGEAQASIGEAQAEAVQTDEAKLAEVTVG